MSKSSGQQVALSIERSLARRMPVRYAKSNLDVLCLPNAECRVANAALRAAIPCTVTSPGTSVTTLPLVESGLIIVGKAICRWAETAASRGFALVARCSFEGGMCIQ